MTPKPKPRMKKLQTTLVERMKEHDGSLPKVLQAKVQSRTQDTEGVRRGENRTKGSRQRWSSLGDQIPHTQTEIQRQSSFLFGSVCKHMYDQSFESIRDKDVLGPKA